MLHFHDISLPDGSLRYITVNNEKLAKHSGGAYQSSKKNYLLDKQLEMDRKDYIET